MKNNVILVALDFPNKETALSLVERLDPKLCRLKVATTMYTRYGPKFIEQLMQQGFDVFLDLKFHDIPVQVAGAVRSAAELGVWMLTLHTQGGYNMMSQAAEAVANLNNKPKLVGVTVLTSLDDSDLAAIGYQQTTSELVPQLAKLAYDSGLDGVVCSPQEVGLLRDAMPQDFLLVTPGIRLAEDSKGDQKRVLTPVEAVKLGADYLVIGRSITQAKNPLQTLNAISSSLVP